MNHAEWGGDVCCGAPDSLQCKSIHELPDCPTTKWVHYDCVRRTPSPTCNFLARPVGGFCGRTVVTKMFEDQYGVLARMGESDAEPDAPHRDSLAGSLFVALLVAIAGLVVLTMSLTCVLFRIVAGPLASAERSRLTARLDGAEAGVGFKE